MVLVQKGQFLQLFFLGDIGQENVFYHILGPKNDFQGSKKRSSKCRKSEIFPKGLTYDFWSKNGLFSNFFFLGNIGQDNSFYDILEGKKCLSTL